MALRVERLVAQRAGRAARGDHPVGARRELTGRLRRQEDPHRIRSLLSVVELLAVSDAEFDASVVLDDAEEGPDAVRVFLTPESAREFATRSNRVISAGRPPCPLCDEPLDPEGHICVRTNGYRRGALGGSDDVDDT